MKKNKKKTVWCYFYTNPPLITGPFLLGAPEDKIDEEILKAERDLAMAGHKVFKRYCPN